MEQEVVVSSNDSSIYDVLSSSLQNCLLYLSKIDRETYGMTACAVFTIIVASTYIFYRVKDKNNPNKNKLLREKGDQKHLECQSKSDNFDYHKILSELHNACNNCSNIFSSMKCIQLTSNYPELINVKLLSDGVTPFHRVCFHGNEALIELMLAKGADPELKTIAGENGLCMALYYYLYTESKNLTCLNLLYDKGCYLNYGDEWYEIFLNLAIKSNNKKLTEWLLTHSKSRRDKPSTRASSIPL